MALGRWWWVSMVGVQVQVMTNIAQSRPHLSHGHATPQQHRRHRLAAARGRFILVGQRFESMPISVLITFLFLVFSLIDKFFFQVSSFT